MSAVHTLLQKPRWHSIIGLRIKDRLEFLFAAQRQDEDASVVSQFWVARNKTQVGVMSGKRKFL